MVRSERISGESKESGRGVTLEDIEALAEELELSHLIDGSQATLKKRQSRVLEFLQGAFGEYFFDIKGPAERRRKLERSAKNVDRARMAVQALQGALGRLDSETVEALYDPFYDDNKLLKPLFRLEAGFRGNDVHAPTNDRPLARKVLESPPFAYLDIVRDLLLTLEEVMGCHVGRYRKSDLRGAVRRDSERSLDLRLFEAFDLAFGGSKAVKASGLIVDEYAERKAMFAARIAHIAGLATRTVGETGRDMRNPSRLVRAAKAHTTANFKLMKALEGDESESSYE